MMRHDAAFEEIHAFFMGGMSPGMFSPEDWESRKTSYGQVMAMIRAGATDEEITSRHPRWTGDVLRVCRKIVNDELCEIKPSPTDPKKKKKRRSG